MTTSENYFAECKTQADIKATFKSLARSLHPDVGGSTEQMQELNRQYWEACQYGPGWDKVIQNLHEGRSLDNNVESALVDPRATITLVASFSGDFIGFCTLDCRTSWSIKVTPEQKIDLKERSTPSKEGRRLKISVAEFSDLWHQGRKVAT